MPYSPVPGLPYCIYRRYHGGRSMSIIDIGAHKGDFTLGLKQVCTINRAVLVEPIDSLAEGLRKNPELQGYTIVECVVAAHDGDIAFNVFPEAPYISSALLIDRSVEDMSRIARTEASSVLRQALTLDSIVDRLDLDDVDLIKIDVQGLEHLVIEGARDVLARTTAVYCEVSFRPLYAGSSVFEDIYRLMSARGFALTALEPGFASQSGELLQADALFVARSWLNSAG